MGNTCVMSSPELGLKRTEEREGKDDRHLERGETHMHPRGLCSALRNNPQRFQHTHMAMTRVMTM